MSRPYHPRECTNRWIGRGKGRGARTSPRERHARVTRLSLGAPSPPRRKPWEPHHDAQRAALPCAAPACSVGTGPFRFGRWQPNVAFTAPAFDGYWQPGLPRVEVVEFSLRDADDLSLPLRAGDLHVARATYDKVAELRADPNIEVQFVKDTSWWFWSFNNRSPRAPFNDLRVREAVSCMLDKAAYMRLVAGEAGVVTNRMAAPGQFFWDEAMHRADRRARPDPDRALLRDAGVDAACTPCRIVSWQNAHRRSGHGGCSTGSTGARSRRGRRGSSRNPGSMPARSPAPSREAPSPGVRRDHLGARRLGAGTASRPAGRDAAASRNRDAADHPRSLGGLAHGRARRGDVGGGRILEQGELAAVFRAPAAP